MNTFFVNSKMERTFFFFFQTSQEFSTQQKVDLLGSYAFDVGITCVPVCIDYVCTRVYRACVVSGDASGHVYDVGHGEWKENQQSDSSVKKRKWYRINFNVLV